MKQLTVQLKKEHFPNHLDEKSVDDAYWVSPCIMEKAIAEQHPQLWQEGVKVGVMGVLYNKPDKAWMYKEVGEIVGWKYEEARAVAARIAIDETHISEYVITLF